MLQTIRKEVRKAAPRSATAPRQRTSSHLRRCNIYCGRMWLRIVASSTLLARSCSDFILFPLLKEHLRGGRYESDDDVIQSVEDFLHEQHELFYQTGIQKLQKRSIKCIEVHGDYVEK